MFESIKNNSDFLKAYRHGKSYANRYLVMYVRKNDLDRNRYGITVSVLSIRLVGIMLLMSLLTLPQITVNLFTSDFKKIILGSIVIGFLGCVSGLVLSYFLNVPSGAFIILVLVLFFLVVKAIKALLER